MEAPIDSQEERRNKDHWLTDWIYVDTGGMCWVLGPKSDISGITGTVLHSYQDICIGHEDDIKTALIRCGLLEFPNRGRPKKEPKIALKNGRKTRKSRKR
jgi:hypothetical protein